MAINNINALVDLEGLENLNNSNFVEKYYNTALANQGQRYTNEKLLEYLTFTIRSLITSINISSEYTHIALSGDIHISESEESLIQISNIDNIRFYLSNGNQIFENISLSNPYNSNTINYIVFNKKLNIIENLYKQIILDLDKDGFDIKDSNSDVIDNQIIFMPLDYEFEYISDGINKSIIYGSNKNIYVYIEPELIYGTDVQTIIGNNNNNISPDIIFIKQNITHERTFVYNFHFEFNNNNSIVLRAFILPYINDTNLWVVNGKTTKISAQAENAVSLNIILAYLYKVGNNIQFKILSGLNDYVYTDNITIEKEVWIKRHNGQLFKIICNIPDIKKVDNDIRNHPDSSNRYSSQSITDILKNSTIILMTRLTQLITDPDIKKEYQDGLITTIWSYNKSTQGYEYVYIETQLDPNGEDLRNVALNFADITNFSNLINYTVANIEQIEPDNYLHTQLVFDQILKTNKQEINNENAYPIMQNIKGNQYNNKYGNNFNFSLRYVNTLLGESGVNIDKGIYNSSVKYLKMSNSDTMNLVTNSLYSIVENNQTKYFPEFIPNYNLPLFDLSEIMIKDINVINRQNIVSFSQSNVYYSYIGTSFDDIDKSILHIGSSEKNINIGDYSLINPNDKNKFGKQKTISIDFSYSYLNGYSFIQNDLDVKGNIYNHKIYWDHQKIDSVDIYSTKIIPKFKYFTDYTNNSNNIYFEINIDTMNDRLINILQNFTTSSKYINLKNKENYLYLNTILTNKINNIDYYYKYNDLLYIPNLLIYLGLTNINLTNISSNTNQIIYDASGNAQFLVSSDNKLVDSINICASTNTSISINIQNIKELYIGNELYIIHTIKNNIHSLIINEQKSHKIRSIWKLPNKLSNN